MPSIFWLRECLDGDPCFGVDASGTGSGEVHRLRLKIVFQPLYPAFAAQT